MLREKRPDADTTDAIAAAVATPRDDRSIYSYIFIYTRTPRNYPLMYPLLSSLFLAPSFTVP